MRLGDSARRGVSGQAKGQLQGVLKEGEVWLEFEVVPHGRCVSMRSCGLRCTTHGVLRLERETCTHRMLYHGHLTCV